MEKKMRLIIPATNYPPVAVNYRLHRLYSLTLFCSLCRCVSFTKRPANKPASQPDRQKAWNQNKRGSQLLSSFKPDKEPNWSVITSWSCEQAPLSFCGSTQHSSEFARCRVVKVSGVITGVRCTLMWNYELRWSIPCFHICNSFLILFRSKLALDPDGITIIGAIER